MKVFKNTQFVLLALFLCACEGNKSDDLTNGEPLTEERITDILGPVLASVNGQDITELDLELAIERTIGSAGFAEIDNQARKKVLESLVMSKSLAIKKQQELSAEELTSVERDVIAYRDELLAKKYLRENISALPVSEEMVKTYYADNPQKFGAEVQKSYELIQASGNISGGERSAIVAALNNAKQEKNWQAVAKQLQSQRLAVEYSQGAVTQGTMAAEFERVLKPLQKGESSSVFFMRKRPAVVRVTDVITQAAKPLSDVSGDIRKQLAPVQLKKAIKSSADDVMKTMTIEYK